MGVKHVNFIVFSPSLTWRDMQHLVVLGSKRNHLHDNTLEHPWKLNGAGLEFNHLFGYGVLDAGAIVDLAINWTTVPERFHCDINTVEINRWEIVLFSLAMLQIIKAFADF